jgi:uncharacterized protein
MTETVLITGASAGIGVELARLFAGDGSELILVARREERLRALAAELRAAHGVTVHVLAADLADPAAPETIVRWTGEQGLAVDVLVNNAGFGARGRFAESEPERQMAMVQVNIAALTHLTRLFLPGMIARRRGGVLNVGSVAGFQPGPQMAVYYASKAYVLHFTEALAEELRGTGVVASCLAPGATATEFASVAGLETSPIFRIKANVADAPSVARAGYEGFRRGRTIVVPGLKNRLATLAVRLAPRVVVRRTLAAIQR